MDGLSLSDHARRGDGGRPQYFAGLDDASRNPARLHLTSPGSHAQIGRREDGAPRDVPSGERLRGRGERGEQRQETQRSATHA
jgi:hypothetical protein